MCLVTGTLLALLAGPAWAQDSGGGTDRRSFVNVVEVSGLLDPVLVDFLNDAIDESERSGAEALVVQLDSRGSVVSDDVLGALVYRIGHASVPVAVWVGPSGSRAVGGSAYLVTEAPLAGMAPKTKLGRAPAFPPFTLPAPLREEAVGPDEAGDIGVTVANEEEAATLGTFIAALDGKEAAGRTVETATFEDVDEGPPEATLTVQARLAKLGLLPRLMHTVASPPVAYLLLIIGLGLLVFELFTAGIGIAGVVGAGCLVLAGYGLDVLPVSRWGLVLILLGMFGYAVDVQTGVPRFWTAVGTVAFVSGTFLLYDGIALPWLAFVVGIAGMLLAMLAGMPAMVRSRFSTPTIGRESMVGELGTATADVRPEGVVQVRDSLWRARTNRATPIAAGDAVRVVGIDGLLLEVEPEEGGARDYRSH